MYLILLALLGVAAPYGIFIYWIATKFNNIGAVLNNELAVGFAVEMAAATLLLTYWFSINRIGKFSVGWFAAFSLVGGLGFAVPMFVWLNRRSAFAERSLILTMRKLRDTRQIKPAKIPALAAAGA